MPYEIRDVLKEAAGPQKSSLGFQEIWIRSRRLRVTKVVVRSVSALALAAGLAGTVNLVGNPLSTDVRDAPGAQSSQSPEGSPTPEPDYSPQSSIEGRLIPEVHTRGDEATFQVVFPDGIQRELVYPKDLDLASFGVRPYVTINGGGSCFGGIVARYNDDRWYRGDSQPITQHQTSDGGFAEVWNVKDVAVSGRYLVFHFGHWSVGVPQSEFCDLAGDQGEMLAKGLTGSETSQGFLLLDPTPPVSFARAIGPEGPSLTFGRGPEIEIFFQDCDLYEAESTIDGRLVNQYQDYSDWCLPEFGIRIQMSGPKTQVEQFIRGLSVKT